LDSDSGIKTFLISLVHIVVTPVALEHFHGPVVCLVMFVYVQGTSDGNCLTHKHMASMGNWRVSLGLATA